MKLTERQKTMIWKATQRKRDAYEKRSARMFRYALLKQYREALAVFDGNPLDQMDSALAKIDGSTLVKPFQFLYKKVAPDFADETYRGLKQQKDEAEYQGWLASLEEYVRLYGAEKIELIIRTSKAEFQKIVKRAMDSAIAEGLSIDNAAKRMIKLAKKEFAGSSFYRAQRIARTEIVAASNYGSLQGAKATNLALDKVWLSTRDSRTRDTHFDIDGQRVGMEENFKVGMDEMQAPGAGSLPEENINCRCTLLYDRKEIVEI